ncbi:MAG: HPr family phosphocarrier protein [Coriobacteriales bacterium]
MLSQTISKTVKGQITPHFYMYIYMRTNMFKSNVKITGGGYAANGKAINMLLTLDYHIDQGDPVEIDVDGPDEQQVMDVLVDTFSRAGKEDWEKVCEAL